MGKLISNKRAAGAIFADLDETATNSAAKGGKFAEVAGAAVVPVKALIDEIDAELALARKVAAPLLAVAEVAWKKACDTVHMAYDVTWNQVGRPSFDPKLSVLFPGGGSHYIEGEAKELPERLELLAQLFEKGLHPKLTKDQNQEAACKIRAAAKEHGEAIEAARLPAAKVVLLGRTRTAMAQPACAALLNFKRMMKVAGFTEAQIHEVLPSHPQASTKKAAAKKAEPAAPATMTEPAATAPAAPAPVTPSPAAQTPAASAPAATVDSPFTG